jgi:predicted Zn-dependent protease
MIRFILILTVLVLSGCFTSEYTVGTREQDVFFYSTEKEVEIGRTLSQEIDKQLEISKNPEVNRKVRAIGERIAGVCDRQEIDYYFYVINEDEKNAFSIPGGYIYLYQGLIDILEEDQLAFVVAHEISHIVSRHSIKRLQAVMGSNLLLLAGASVESDSNFTQGLNFALAQLLVAYSRKDEFNADELAVKYLRKAGYNPRAGIKLLNKLYQQGKEEPLKELSYFRTHPYTAQRIANIKSSLGLTLEASDYIN